MIQNILGIFFKRVSRVSMHAPKQMLALISAGLAQRRNGPLRRQGAPFRGVNCTLHRFTRRTVISTVLSALNVARLNTREYAIRVAITRDEYARTSRFRCVLTNALENRPAARNHAYTWRIEAPAAAGITRESQTLMARAEFLAIVILCLISACILWMSLIKRQRVECSCKFIFFPRTIKEMKSNICDLGDCISPVEYLQAL